MGKFVILADGTCDLTQELRERFDIEYINGHIVLPNGEEQPTMLDWSLLDYDEFYTSLRKGSKYSTSPANITEYEQKMSDFIERGYDILSMSLSSGMSGTYNFACKARENVLQKYPNAKIICFDSLRYSALLGLMCIYASILRGEGKTLEETAAWLEENKNRFHQMGWVDDLTFLAKQGRINAATAFFGQLVGVKPVGDIDYNGMTTVLGKAKSEKSGYETILKYIEATAIDIENQIVFIGYSYRERQAQKLKVMIEEKFHPKEILMTTVFPACGANIGPGLMACYYMGKPITKDLADEKAIMSKILGIEE